MIYYKKQLLKLLCCLCISFSTAGAETFLPESQFDTLTDVLRATLKGSFVTVWRSEWKAKLSEEESNFYVLNLLERFLSEKTRALVLKDLDPSKEGFTRQISERLWKIQRSDLLPEDRIRVRDQAPMPGVVDSTFTYYAKQLSDEGGVGKHQIRLRSYLRRIYLDEIKEGETAVAFTKLAEEIQITKLEKDQFSVIINSNGSSTKSILASTEIHELLGNPIILFAIPGGTFKFEIKTALKDLISGEKYPLLAGHHMVQKLDICGLSFKQLEELFREHGDGSEIDRLELELLEAHPEAKERILAVFAVLHKGFEVYGEDFFVLEGATHYQRCALEGLAGFQTTIDREQEVFWKTVYREDGSLKDPKETLLTSRCLVPKEKSERHVEIKFPSDAVAKNVGVLFYQTPEPDSTNSAEVDQEFQDAASLYHQYPKDNRNHGKFKYIIDNGVFKKLTTS